MARPRTKSAPAKTEPAEKALLDADTQPAPNEHPPEDEGASKPSVEEDPWLTETIQMPEDPVAALNDKLREIEANPASNKLHAGRKRYDGAGAFVDSEGAVRVQYVFAGGSQVLGTVEDAQQYLDWLREGNDGTHFTMRKEKRAATSSNAESPPETPEDDS